MSITEQKPESDVAVGAVLSDGTSVASLIDVERRTASLRLFSDPEVYAAEQRWLFGRCWNIVGHESEIPNSGDYVARRIADDSVIVSRDREGQINVLLNVCTHRGMQVCRSEAGNAANFKCPYHGWVFGTEGNLLGAPFEREMYGTELDKPNLGLRKARVSTYAGIIYANWDGSAPPLEDFLGGYTWYLDTIFNRTKSGLECVGAPQRSRIQSNWKAPSEQFNGADGYHVATLHKSLTERLVGDDATPAQLQEATRLVMFGIDIGSRLGHGLRATPRRAAGRTGLRGPDDRVFNGGLSDLESLTENPPQGLPRELVPEIFDILTPGQIKALVKNPPGPGGMFPNVGFLHANLRVHIPTGVDSFEMLNFVLVEKDASPEHKAEVRRQMLLGFGTSGTVEQDDAESWPAMQKAATGFQGKQQKMRYQAFVGDKAPEGWEGPEEVYDGFSKDDSAWNFWQRYRDYMSGGSLELDTK
jgi:phenylpropionate dioxygenase-like ring-hydroxylating dioxygenase large terminal subunit